MGGVFWSSLTPREEVAKAKRILVDLARDFSREAGRLEKKRAMSRACVENALDEEDRELALMHAETAVTHGTLMQFYTRQANAIGVKAAGLDERNVYVTMAQVSAMLGRAARNVVGSQTMNEFSQTMVQQQKNLAQLTLRNELIEETLVLGDEHIDDADDMFDPKGDHFKQEVAKLMHDPTEESLDALMDKAPSMADVRRHRARSLATTSNKENLARK